MISKTFGILGLLSAVLIVGCTSSQEKKAETARPVSRAKPPTEPFRFHRAIEVRPGLTFDVVSWGRGSETTGAFMILRSDSTNLRYRSTTGELDGKIVEAWNMDMDSDGNPEIFIHAEGEGEGSHLNMYVYEFNDSGSSQKITFPGLSTTSKKGYKGQDTVFVKDGKLMREFPVYEDKDAPGKPTGGKKALEYSLRSNSFVVKEIKAEQTDSKRK